MLDRLARVPGRSAEAAAAQSDVLIALGCPAEAEDAASCALAVGAADPALPCLRAEARPAMQDQRGAAADAAGAVMADPASPHAKSPLGRAMLVCGRLDEAVSLLGQALLAAPSDRAARMALARSFEAAGRHAAAAELILLPDAPAAAPPAIGASPLCDAPRIGANLARFLRGAWHGWCAGEDAAAAATVTAAGQGNARVRALAPA